jgi:hypothetical protein
MIEQFVKDILKQKGLPPNLDQAVYDKLVSDLTERATDLVNKRLIEAMSEEQAKKLEDIMNSEPDNAQAVQDFITQNVPNHEAVASAALIEFRQLYLGTPS